ncbi:Ribosylnicotinamide kinase homolog / Unknown conserved in Flavobacteria [hydrothermal vent metagenome]|uniref:DUF4301 domain-containing protein n=1 Tax=hydrothermal vent metagenome TaxID=652676 RepID=A0A3B0WPE4_9ZZZZ
MITEVEYAQFKGLGLDKERVNKQFSLLTTGVQFAKLAKPATLNDGIESLSKEKATQLAKTYEREASNTSILKFVPASGAATRMFKELSAFAETGAETEAVLLLFESFDQLPFASQVPSNLSKFKKAAYILKNLAYATTPKGLIPFHQYQGFTRTAFKEHWIEGLHYAASKENVNLHFTVSENHQDTFEQIYNTRITSFSKEYNRTLNIKFSQQAKNTNTLIINKQGEIIKDKRGMPITRPGGHGSLINNLNELSVNLVFIKNIDNVVHQNHLDATVLFKKALAGKLLELKSNIFNALESIEGGNVDLTYLEALGKEIHIITSNSYIHASTPEKIDFWKTKLNRPIRVCGMVKNLGEAGGGPFWVSNEESTSLQIVESAQIDRAEQYQEKILQSSTHFNPVDLVCYLTNYKGNKFNLLNFVDESAAFITTKKVNGVDVNVLEHPGLWNGAMANWITLFVEVPIETFNPVKTVNDLLKTAHLS